uniref:KIAA1522 n=1 Tax=Malurus cyaneus samueli TaxID=2593467 RepID=A0A8C5TY86_9PASS
WPCPPGPADPAVAAVPAGAAKGEGEKRLSVQYTAGEECPDNVFFPSTRPPHLEELHNQAQQGLKSLQHQGRCPQPRGGLGDTASSLSRSTSGSGKMGTLGTLWPGPPSHQLDLLTPLVGSTFRPHDSFPKSSERAGKKRKERRTTVLGIPQHVHKELGNRVAQPLLNGGQVPGDAIRIPTIDGKLQPPPVAGGARVCLGVLEEADAALQQHINRVYYDDTLLGRKTAAKLSPMVRPKSLAVPGMTTYANPPETLAGPVMSISPQGTYMSKIIPNAILPPMVDVVALTRSSVRTLSRCSLVSSSPASVRSLSRFSERGARSREPSSSSDNWSHSQSTETIVSNSSTISSQGGSEHRQPEPATGLAPTAGGLPGRTSPAYSTSSQAEGSDTASLASERSSTRSVSLRKMKKPPAPPRRTYSLHQKADGEPKVLGLPPRPERRLRSESLAGTGSPEASCPDGSDRTMSPSSGYSSQSGTPTLPTKGLGPPAVSPGKSQPQKPERVCSLQSPALSVSSSLTSISSSASDPTPPEALSGRSDRFIIPPHPSSRSLLPPHPSPSSPGPRRPPASPAAPGPPDPAALAEPPKPNTAGQEPRQAQRQIPPPTPRLPAASPAGKKAEGALRRAEAPADTAWPPAAARSEEHDLSMADFPPPDESDLSGLPDATPPRRRAGGHASSGAASSHPQPPSLPPALPPQISLKKAANGPRAEAKKEPVSRSKSGPAAKEDASLPIVTPSLLQMVRLRSVSVEPRRRSGRAGAGPEERPVPQKPVRRSLSTRQPPPAKDAVPSNQLHQAVHLKAAALASAEPAEKISGGRATQAGPEGLPADGQLSPRNKSPASTASFIFAKSSRKLVIETASSPEAQADLKRNLVAELMNLSGQRSAVPVQTQRKPGKIPPPVAKKPSLGPGPAPSPKAPGVEAWAPRWTWAGQRTSVELATNLIQEANSLSLHGLDDIYAKMVLVSLS